MTTEKLQQKPIGVLETRSFIIKHNGHEYEEHYSLVKGKDGKYFIGFSSSRNCTISSALTVLEQ